jgi:hypothetical protein
MEKLSGPAAESAELVVALAKLLLELAVLLAERLALRLRTVLWRTSFRTICCRQMTL